MNGTGTKLIALTYDDGPHPKITPSLARVLDAADARATFFLLGQRIRAYRQIAAELCSLRHELGNHTFTHRSLTGMSEGCIRREIEDCGELIASVSGKHSPLMRPPYGAVNTCVRSVAAKMGLRIVLWNVDTNDWRGNTAKDIKNHVLGTARNGSIILMHDRYETTLTATTEIVEALSLQGYRFVTVSELLDQLHVLR